MNSLVVGMDSPAIQQARAALRSLGHDVNWFETVPDAKEKVNSIPENIFLELSSAAGEMIAFIRELRTRKSPHYPFVTGVTGALSHTELSNVYAAGFDLILPKPLTEEAIQLAAQVGARVASWRPDKAVIPKTEVPVAAFPQATTPEALLGQISQSQAFTNAATHLEKATGGFLMLPATVIPRRAPIREATAGCRVLLSNPELGIELHISIATDQKTLNQLAIHIMGEEDPEFASDIINEIANTQMGGFKSAFKKEAINFVGGLPVTIEASEVLAPTTVYHRAATFTIEVTGGEFTAHVGYCSKANVFHVPGELRESMVVVNDVFNARGMLLISSGTRLSERMVERVRSAVPDNTRIEVMLG